MNRLLLSFGLLILPATARAADEAAKVNFFERRIRPVLVKHCYGCHSERAAATKKLKGGLKLDRRAAALRGGDSGRVIVPGKPQQSLLIKALRYESLQMPPTRRLPKRVINDFARWIRDGATWPKNAPVTAKNKSTRHSLKDFAHWRRNHWAWRPIQDPTVPHVADDTWSENAIDRFILARLRTAKLRPSPPADRRTLYRRLSFHLTGLPPSYAETKQFIADARPHAYQLAVDRFLSSPAFGEKWGRHWLDIARYADNGGFNSQTPELYTEFHYAYTYRDYVVRSLNEDLPYDRFILEQIAADRLNLGEDNRALAALGFLTLGDKSFGISLHDRIDDCIDTITRGLMAITVSCARCHDHKYDPIPTADYYSLYSVFRNSEFDLAARRHDIRKCDVYPPIFRTQAERSTFQRRVRDAKTTLRVLRKKYGKKPTKAQRAEIARAARSAQQVEFKHPRAVIARDRKRLATGHIFVRGNPRKPGGRVLRHFLRLLSPQSPDLFTDGSGRLDLARAIVDRQNPLTARVIVNRVWQQYFGVGLVRSSGDFGTRSDAPSHPKLLDYLATRLIEEGWSLKKLHRRILLSSTFRQSSMARADVQAHDPDNRLLCKMNRRRLSFEEIRDSLLCSADNLDQKMGGYPEQTWSMRRRTLYGYIDRYRIAIGYEMFDFPYPGRTAVQRSQTLVPQQSLFLMNSRFVRQQANRVAQFVAQQHSQDEERIRFAFRTILSRDPSIAEIKASLSYLAGNAGQGAVNKLCHALLLSNEYMYVD